MRYKWGHPVATLPSDEGDYTSLEVGHKLCKSGPKKGTTCQCARCQARLAAVLWDGTNLSPSHSRQS
eukprot:199340-Pleurochrysis_carterae.AAC.1